MQPVASITVAASLPRAPGRSIAAICSPLTPTSSVSAAVGVTTVPPRTRRSYVISSPYVRGRAELRLDVCDRLVRRGDGAVEALHDRDRGVVHLLAVCAAGVLDQEAVVAVAGRVAKGVLDAHVRRDAGEEQRVDAVGAQHDLDRSRREGARSDLVEHPLVGPRRELVDDLVLALAHPVVRSLTERPHLVGE